LRRKRCGPLQADEKPDSAEGERDVDMTGNTVGSATTGATALVDHVLPGLPAAPSGSDSNRFGFAIQASENSISL
jgi:hypothetical protein